LIKNFKYEKFILKKPTMYFFVVQKDNPAVQDVDGFVRGLGGSLASH